MHNCTTCSKTYVRAEHLRRHTAIVHAPISESNSSREKYRCSFDACGRSFTRSDALLRHKRIHNQSPGSSTYRQPVETSFKRPLDLSPEFKSPSSSLLSRQGHATSEQQIQLQENEKEHFFLAPDANQSVTSWQSRQSILEEEQRQSQSQLPAYEINYNGNNEATLGLLSDIGSNEAGAIPDHYFSGLDWIFDDLTDVNIPQPVFSTASEGSQWQGGQSLEIGEAYGNDDSFIASPDTTETLNLLNLANTALYMSNTSNQFTSRKALNQQAMPFREEDGESSWPQEYRPMRKNPPIIELSAFSLSLDVDAVNSKESDLQDDIILIEDTEEEESSPLKWTVTETTRQKLLSYLTHSCRHSWSIYSFDESPPACFLTTSQLQKLVNLFFSKFHPFVPVLHPATFDPATAPPVLLLIVITIGLVFYPTEVISNTNANSRILVNLRKTTSTLAVAFSELVRIGVCSAYEADQRGFTDVSINQAWTLQQTFGIGSGDKRLNKLAERNRGGIVTAVRRIGLLSQAQDLASAFEVGDHEINDAATRQRKWYSWIVEESRLRLGWFIYLYDQTFSCYLDVAPMFRYTEVTSSMPCHSDIWNAENADVWIKKSRKARSETSGRKTLHDVLRQLLQQSSFSKLHFNQLEAYILAVTLYRIRWDASKEKIVFGNGQLSFGMDAAAEKAMQRLFDAAAIQDMTSLVPLSSDVQLLHLLGKLHFTGPSLFFDKLRDAAGRSGMSSKRRQDAISWLQDWINTDSSHQIAMRRILLTSSQIFAFERSSCLKAKRDKIGLMQSNIRTMSLFHAALGMWAYTQFAVEGSCVGQDSLTETLPRISPDHIAFIQDKGIFHLDSEVDPIDDGNGISTSANLDLVEAWVCGRYVSTFDEKTYDWPLSPMSVSVEGIGSLMEQTTITGKMGQSRASRVLERFAMLLARHEWGLAASFRLILLHMARHAVK